MPFAINLRASGDAASYWELVDQVASLEAQPSIKLLGYPPHITLAKYDDADVAEMASVVDALATVAPLTLTFNKLGSFDPGILILWAAPTPEQTLLDLHALVHTIIDPSRCKQPYRPEHWTPHCSIALRIAEDRRANAARFLVADRNPFTLTFDIVDAVASPPIVILKERQLCKRRSDDYARTDRPSH